MTNKEAIKYLKWIRPIRPYSLYKKKVQESIDLAIKALEFVESQRLCCDNCVNRNSKSKAVCSSPFGKCMYFDDETNSEKGGAE